MNSKFACAALLGLLLSLLLGGCATSPPALPDDPYSAPVERESEISQEDMEDPFPESSAATDSLLLAAKQASEREDYSNAIVYLERAVRIDPRNAQLWIQLSAAHLADQNFAAATQHARKAIALAGQDAGLTSSAWLQLAAIREAQGDVAEAAAIRRRFGSVRG